MTHVCLCVCASTHTHACTKMESKPMQEKLLVWGLHSQREDLSLPNSNPPRSASHLSFEGATSFKQVVTGRNETEWALSTPQFLAALLPPQNTVEAGHTIRQPQGCQAAGPFPALVAKHQGPGA